MPKVGKKCYLVVSADWCVIIQEKKRDYFSFPAARNCWDWLTVGVASYSALPVRGGLSTPASANEDNELMQKCVCVYIYKYMHIYINVGC